MSDVKKKLIDYILKNKEYQNTDGSLNKYKFINDIEEIKPSLASYLASIKDKKIFSLVFSKIADMTVLNQNILIKIVNSKEYVKNSTTFYQNKIGLVNNGSDVVLDFPFKDCVLLGGMDKEDEKNKTEVFYHELLDKDKIDNLFSPKVFTNVERYEKSDDSNLIVKGNNLIGLHTLSERYKELIDVIYIDPPYFFKENKNADSFAYNSNFKLSTWLTFMKNRLEISKNLLSNRGCIFISLDQGGIHHLKLLCDEIFGVDNFIDFLTIVNNLKGRSDDEFFATSNEFCLCYSKNISDFKLNGLPMNENELKTYKFKDEMSKYKPIGLKKTGKNSLKKDRPNMFYPIYYNKATKELSLDKICEEDIEILPITPEGEDGCWRWGKETFLKNKDSELIVNVKGNEIPVINVKMRDILPDGNPRTKKAKTLFLDPKYDSGKGTSLIKKYFGNKELFSNPKPLDFIKDLLFIGSQKDSIILDFFSGSGTTGHAVLDLNRQDGGNRKFILLEQMDYAKDITAERLRRVISQEKLNQSFTYCELLKDSIKENIKKCKKDSELIKLVDSKFHEGYFQYIDSKEELLNILKEQKDIKVMKKILIENYLDHNREYIPYSDIKSVKLDKKDLEFNKKFYGEDDE